MRSLLHRARTGVLLTAAAAGLAVGGAGVASAAGAAGHHGSLHASFGGRVLHAQWTVAERGSTATYVTLAEQTGQVIDPSTTGCPTSSSTTTSIICVSSADGFVQGYVVSSSTRVWPKGATIATGDTVVVEATVPTTAPDTANAVRDVTVAKADRSQGGATSGPSLHRHRRK